MIRFRNPGTQYTTQIQVFRELYKEYKDAESFGLNEMAQTITRCYLMTAYGYAGDAALSLSDTDDTSRNSTLMNAKMYAEVFRLLGWIASKGESSYPLVFTYIGEHAAVTENVLPIYEQCVLGINNPQEIMGVKYTEKVRFFKTALFTMMDLNNVIYKHELCLGPMCIDDLDSKQYSDMIAALKKLRGSYRRLTAAYSALCDELGVKKTLPDNSTRLPIAFMKTCGWVEAERRSDLYAPKSLECLRITIHGMEVANSLKSMKDICLDEYRKCSREEKDALIRLGVFAMLKRSGYDVSPVAEQIKEDTNLCREILNGKEILFSPYQTLKCTEVEAALGIVRKAGAKVKTSAVLPEIERTDPLINQLPLSVPAQSVNSEDAEIKDFRDEISEIKRVVHTNDKVVQRIFESRITATQTSFYPFIAMLFRVMGLDCQASRPGDNGARWDAIVVHETNSIPIEIKSPTEEHHLSMKAIRQALENKVILLSRKTHITTPDTASLAVGYYLPNDRAEVTRLIKDIKEVYGFRIGVIDLKTLITIAVSIIEDNKSFDLKRLFELEGYADATIR